MFGRTIIFKKPEPVKNSLHELVDVSGPWPKKGRTVSKFLSR